MAPLRKLLRLCCFTTTLGLSLGAAQFHAPPGRYTTSWVGNSFGGNGGDNGFGYWVQNGADEIEVTPDGTVIAGVDWDEAGRCLGLYKDGQVNRVLVKHNQAQENSAWGWGTGNRACAVNGGHIFLANTGRRLARFRWTPGSLNSAAILGDVAIPKEAVGLTSRGAVLALVYADAIELRTTNTLAVTGGFPVAQALDAAIAPDGSLWVIAGGQVRHFDVSGTALPGTITSVGKPSAVAFDHDGRLIVCDDGPRQQVLFFDVGGEPRLLKTFGDEGGLRNGTPGVAKPHKLFALRGAGTDAQGNLYVGMSFGNGPNGNFFLRSFTPGGELRWELHNAAFVDTFGFDPDSDGRVVYGRNVIYDLDLNVTAPGREAKLRAVTLDHVTHPGDARLGGGKSVLLRWLQGRRLMYQIGQYAGGFELYAFDEPQGQIARRVGSISANDKWAWDVDERGGIWHGDADGRRIRHYPFKGWKADGTPDYDWARPQSWAWPAGWDLIRRIQYVAATDTLYLTGYLSGQRVETWGVIGATACRYDGWLAGARTPVWTNNALPRDGNTDPNEGPLTPQAFDVAGDYFFLGMVKPTDGKQYVHVHSVTNGAYVGTFQPGTAVGELAGWLDMPYALQAFKRANGEYLILVEEDFRGKNLLYRWCPAGDCPAAPPLKLEGAIAPPAQLELRVQHAPRSAVIESTTDFGSWHRFATNPGTADTWAALVHSDAAPLQFFRLRLP